MLPTFLATQLVKARFLLGQNSSTILTGMGVAGTISTAILSARGTFKASDVIAHEKQTIANARDALALDSLNDDASAGAVSTALGAPVELSRLEQIKLVWPFYIPAVTTGVLTIMAIVAANRIDSKKIAALTVASGLSDRALQEYKAKVEEKLTARQATAVKDDIANDHVQAKPVPSESVLMVGDGEVLCFDVMTSRYFKSTVEDIKRAENKINHAILNSGGASLADFHDEIGLESTPLTDMLGWGVDNMITVEFHSVLKENKPVVAVDFNYPPTAAYLKLH